MQQPRYRAADHVLDYCLTTTIWATVIRLQTLHYTSVFHTSFTWTRPFFSNPQTYLTQSFLLATTQRELHLERHDISNHNLRIMQVHLYPGITTGYFSLSQVRTTEASMQLCASLPVYAIHKQQRIHDTIMCHKLL